MMVMKLWRAKNVALNWNPAWRYKITQLPILLFWIAYQVRKSLSFLPWNHVPHHLHRCTILPWPQFRAILNTIKSPWSKAERTWSIEATNLRRTKFSCFRLIWRLRCASSTIKSRPKASWPLSVQALRNEVSFVPSFGKGNLIPKRTVWWRRVSSFDHRVPKSRARLYL